MHFLCLFLCLFICFEAHSYNLSYLTYCWVGHEASEDVILKNPNKHFIVIKNS